MPGGDAIYFGAGTTQGSTVWPSATVDAWNEFLGLSTISASVLGSPTHSSLSTIAITGKSSTSAAAAIRRSGMMRAGTIAIVMGLAFAIF
jgi:carboxypeptidase D